MSIFDANHTTAQGSITAAAALEDMARALRDPPPSAAPYGFGGSMNLYEMPPPPAKISLRPAAPVTAAFREEFNAWLLDRFGTVEALRADQVYMYGNCVLAAPAAIQAIYAATT